jgi:5-methylcytosine-specific restriction endonuclease McrA
MGKHWTTEKPAWNAKPPVVRKCHYPGCDVMLVLTPSYAARGVKACSLQHQYLPRPLIEGRRARDWPTTRAMIRERDGNRCRACGGRGKRLEVHHLDHDEANDAPTNLVTLCSACHQGGHRRRAWPIDLTAA